jgi:hypothetical protein
MTTEAAKVPAWLGFNVAALMASFAHQFIDAHLGLFGVTSPVMTGLEAANIAKLPES